MDTTERELAELLSAAAAHPGEWRPDTAEQIADRAEAQASFGPLQSIYR